MKHHRAIDVATTPSSGQPSRGLQPGRAGIEVYALGRIAGIGTTL